MRQSLAEPGPTRAIIFQCATLRLKMIYLHSDCRYLAPSQNTKTRLITRALSLSPFETTLSLSLTHFLDVFCLSSLSGGPHPLSFLISISFSDFWLSGFSPLCLILNLPLLPLSFCLSIYCCPSLSTHLIQSYAFYSPSTLSFFSTFLDFSHSVFFYASLDLFGLCGLLFMIIFNLLGTCVGNIRSCYLFI